MAASTYPARAMPSQARATIDDAGRYQVSIAAADIGTGARTALSLVAAETLAVPSQLVEVRIGDSALPEAMIAGGSMGTASWSWAVVKACLALRETIDVEHHGVVPPGGLSADASTERDIEALADYARYSFGAQFAEVRVDVDTGEVRVPRLLGVFAAGPHRQRHDGSVPVHRRHDDGTVHGVARGKRHGPRVRRLPQSRLRRLSHRSLCRCG